MCIFWDILGSHTHYRPGWENVSRSDSMELAKWLQPHHHSWDLQTEVLPDGDQRMSVIWICKTTPNQNPYAQASGSKMCPIHLNMNTLETNGFSAYLTSPDTWVDRREDWVGLAALGHEPWSDWAYGDPLSLLISGARTCQKASTDGAEQKVPRSASDQEDTGPQRLMHINHPGSDLLYIILP